jgi:hypothetical protein
VSGTYRHGRTYCQVADCRRRAMRAVEIELPTDWNATLGFRVLTVMLGTCVRHGREIERHATALLEARAEQEDLIRVIALAVETDAAAREVIERMERDLGEAEGAVAYQRERADRAEAEAAEERHHAMRAEAALRLDRPGAGVALSVVNQQDRLICALMAGRDTADPLRAVNEARAALGWGGTELCQS